MKKALNQLSEFVENHKTAILVTETTIITVVLVAPKVRNAIMGYKELQNDAKEAKLAIYAVAALLAAETADATANGTIDTTNGVGDTNNQ